MVMTSSSSQRVAHDPDDYAKASSRSRRPIGGEAGYLPIFESRRYQVHSVQWDDQEATAFPDKWSIGLSFFHNVFAREHNRVRGRIPQTQNPEDDSGLRDPENPKRSDIIMSEVTDEELFEIARLVVSAEIAKIHTTEWTTQLLYDEPLYLGMNANWHGLGRDYEAASGCTGEGRKSAREVRRPNHGESIVFGVRSQDQGYSDWVIEKRSVG